MQAACDEIGSCHSLRWSLHQCQDAGELAMRIGHVLGAAGQPNGTNRFNNPAMQWRWRTSLALWRFRLMVRPNPVQLLLRAESSVLWLDFSLRWSLVVAGTVRVRLLHCSHPTPRTRCWCTRTPCTARLLVRSSAPEPLQCLCSIDVGLIVTRSVDANVGKKAIMSFQFVGRQFSKQTYRRDTSQTRAQL